MRASVRKQLSYLLDGVPKPDPPKADRKADRAARAKAIEEAERVAAKDPSAPFLPPPPVAATRPQGGGSQPHLPYKPKDIRLDRPRQLELLVRAYILNGMDLDRTLATSFPGLTNEEHRRLSARIEGDPRFSAAVEQEMAPVGMEGDAAITKYKKRLWDWFLGDDKDLAQTAARLLGRAYIAEQQPDDKPVALPIAGLDKLVDGMDLEGKGKGKPPSEHGETIQ